jgi:arylamine N-acetyltransferase
MKENANGAMALLVEMFVQDLWNVLHVLQKQDSAAKDHQVIEHLKYTHKESKLLMQLMMQMVSIGNWLTLTKSR